MQIGREDGFKIHSGDDAGKPVAEGIVNARTVKLLSQRYRIEMPIVDAVFRTLYEAKPPKAMVDELLSRALKSEF
jgi:glycerol-3-phosphate dehydrogenase